MTPLNGHRRSHPYPRPAGNLHIRHLSRMKLTSRTVSQAAIATSDQRNGFPERQTLCRMTASFLASATRALPTPDRLAIAGVLSQIFTGAEKGLGR